MQCLVSLGCLNLALKKLHNDTRNFFARDCAIYDKLLLSLGAALFLPLEMNSIVQKRNSNKFINRLITLHCTDFSTTFVSGSWKTFS